MTCLVILHGVKWLLDHSVFPFDSYLVEYGHDDENGFDIRASQNGKTLVGEAFNVARSFFPNKKSAMLQKLRGPSVEADYKIIMFNHDAVGSGYVPKSNSGEFFIFVGVGSGESKMVPNLA
jgi:hypothetical protein